MTIKTYRQTEPILPESEIFSWPDDFLDDNARTEYIFSHFYEPLNFLARRIVRSTADSEDIAMNVIIRVVNSQTQPKTYEHLKRRLYVSVRNEAINYWRYRLKQNQARANLLYLTQTHAYPSQSLPAQDKEKISRNILAEIKRLPRQQRAVLQLYFFEAMNTGQIGRVLGISKQTVLNHRSKALNSLRNSGLKDVWNCMVK